MWGKLTKVITDPLELYRFLSKPEIVLANLVLANDTVFWVSCPLNSEGKVKSLSHTNEVIWFYVTAGAKIHLCSYLDRLQNGAMYCDIDSVLYVQPNGWPGLVETGDFGWYDVRTAARPIH
jgi:hypothetical protein